MYTHTKFDHEFHPGTTPTLLYAVASTPRCGSSLLCEALCLLGAGAPTEFFDEQTLTQFMEAWNLRDAAEYLPELLKRKTSPNGVFGFKAHFHQYKSQFGVDALPQTLPRLKFIWIRRKDTECQAVSYWRAIQTNQWASTHRSTNPSPHFDGDEIRRLELQIIYEETEWEAFFRQHQLLPRVVQYSELAESPFSVAGDCLDWLGIAPLREQLELSLQRQSDELNASWLRQYQDFKSL